MNEMIESPVKCRTAMLQMNLTYEGMASLLGLDRSRIVKMCLAGEDIPRHLLHKVRVLMNAHRTYVMKRPIMELVQDLLRHLARNGACHLDKVIRTFGLSGQQLKNIEQVEGWLTLVWEPTGPNGREGRHAFIYLTAAGYKELGIIMPADAAAPSVNSKALMLKGFEEVQRSLVEALDKREALFRELADNSKSIKMLVITGVATVETAIGMYEALMTGLDIEPLQLTDQSNEEQ